MKHLRFPLLIFGMVLLSAPAAAVEVNTSVTSVAHEGEAELIGSFSFTLSSDDFGAASPEQPIYIRISLSKFQGWGATLVDQREGSQRNVPINLAISPSDGTFINPAIPKDAIQLVRLIQGESYAFLKVTYSSSLWVYNANIPSPPSQSRQVSFGLGIRGEASVRLGAHTVSGGNEYADNQLLADTRIFADYRDTPDFNNGDIEALNLVTFDHQSQGIETGTPILGHNLDIGFSNDFVVARGFNFYPCFEFHTAAANYDSPALALKLGKVDLIQRRTYTREIPSLFLSNSSDFAWEPGSRFFITYEGFNSDYRVEGTIPPQHYNPQAPTTHLEPSTLELVSAENETWLVEEVYYEEKFMGYQLTLQTGVFGIDRTIEVSHLKIFTRLEAEAQAGAPLKLRASAYYKAQGVNVPGHLGRIGNIDKVIATLTLASDRDGFETIIPYAPYDRPELQFSLVVTNPTAEPVRYAAMVYHPAGLLEEVLGARTLPPFGQETISFDDLPDSRRKYGWSAVFSEKRVNVVGVLRGYDGKSLDVFGPSTSLTSTLYGAHITSDPLWETTAYLVSANSDVDPLLYYYLDGVGEGTRVGGLILPGAAGRLNDQTFHSENGRASWFRVHSVAPVATGMLLFNSRDDAMLATQPLAPEAKTQWSFPHLGKTLNGWWNGLVIVNTSTEPSNVTLSLTSTGQGSISTTDLVLAPGQRLIGQVSNLTGSNLGDKLTLVSSQPSVAFLMMGNFRGDRLTAIPGNLPSANESMLPHFPTLLDHWVGLALINEEVLATTVTLTPMLSDGSAGSPFDVQVEPGEKQLVDLSNYLDEAANYNHLLIESQVAIKTYALTGDKANHYLATLPISTVAGADGVKP